MPLALPKDRPASFDTVGVNVPPAASSPTPAASCTPSPNETLTLSSPIPPPPPVVAQLFLPTPPLAPTMQSQRPSAITSKSQNIPPIPQLILEGTHHQQQQQQQQQQQVMQSPPGSACSFTSSSTQSSPVPALASTHAQPNQPQGNIPTTVNSFSNKHNSSSGSSNSSNNSTKTCSSNTISDCVQLVHRRSPGYVQSAFGEPLRTLGKGTGGSVTLHRHPWTGAGIAIKRFSFGEHINHSAQLAIVTNEASIALKLNHPNIVRTFAYVAEGLSQHKLTATKSTIDDSDESQQTEQQQQQQQQQQYTFYAVMEAHRRDMFGAIREHNQERQQLQQHLQHTQSRMTLSPSVAAALNANSNSKVQTGLPVARANRIFLHIVRAIHYMHTEHRTAHRDIKLDNVCVTDGDDSGKLLDFGAAITVPVPGTLVTGICGSDPYLAPEVIRYGNTKPSSSHKSPSTGSSRSSSAGYDPFKADIWSLGLVYLASVTGFFPWRLAAPATDCSFARFVRKGPQCVVAEWLATCGDASACGLISAMLDTNPATRLNIDQVLVHPWMRQVIAANTN